MQQPDAVTLAATEDRLDLRPAEALHFGAPQDFLDSLQTFKPIGMPCHISSGLVYTIWRSYVTMRTPAFSKDPYHHD
jgi:hypothetical protein